VSQASAEEAAANMSGNLWGQALAEAKANDNADQANPFDFISTILSPALYLTTPYYALTGQKEKISPLPTTRLGWAAQAALKGTGAQGVGDFAGAVLAGPETYLRNKAGLPEFGEFGDYYIDRQLANMAADGTADAEAVQQAMIERAGNPLFEQARQRVLFEMMLKVPGAAGVYSATHGGGVGGTFAATVIGLFPGGLLPEGELRYRGLKERYGAAWDLYKKGDTSALQDFFEEYPEYEARLALRDEPQERLRQFLVGQVWDRYMTLDKSDRRLARPQLGPQFQSDFLDENTRSYEAIDIETLALWSQMLGGLVPETPETAEVAGLPDYATPPLQGMPEQFRAPIQEFYDLKDKKYQNITAIQSGYFSEPPGAARRRYLSQWPQLKNYWDWRRAYIAQHPEIEPFISQTAAENILSGQQSYSYLPPGQIESLLGLYYQQSQTTQATAVTPDYFGQLSPLAQRQVVDYSLRGTRPGAGAMTELARIWNENGRPGATVQDFLILLANQ